MISKNLMNDELNKIYVMGDIGVGKTNLIKRYILFVNFELKVRILMTRQRLSWGLLPIRL